MSSPLKLFEIKFDFYESLLIICIRRPQRSSSPSELSTGSIKYPSLHSYNHPLRERETFFGELSTAHFLVDIMMGNSISARILALGKPGAVSTPFMTCQSGGCRRVCQFHSSPHPAQSFADIVDLYFPNFR